MLLSFVGFDPAPKKVCHLRELTLKLEPVLAIRGWLHIPKRYPLV